MCVIPNKSVPCYFAHCCFTADVCICCVVFIILKINYYCFFRFPNWRCIQSLSLSHTHTHTSELKQLLPIHELKNGGLGGGHLIIAHKVKCSVSVFS